MVRSLYTSADMEEDLSVTLEQMDRFKHMRGPFGVVFQGQSNGDVTVHINSHGRRPLHNFGTNGQVTQSMALETPKTARASTKK